MAEIIVFRGPDGTEQSYHSVQDSATVREYMNTPGLTVAKRFTVPDVSERPADAPEDRRVTARGVAGAALPFAAATVGSALVPEVAGPMWLYRMLAAGGAGAASDPAARTLRGEQPSLRGAAMTGAETALGAGAGEVLSGAGRLGARTLMRSAQSRGVTPRLQEEFAASLSRRLGRRVEPQEADFATQALKERVPVGPKVLTGRTGSTVVSEKIGRLAGELDNLLAEAETNGMRFNIMDATKNMGELRTALGRESQSTKLVAALNKRLREIVAGKRVPGKAKLVKFTPREFNALKRTWQEASEGILSGRTPAGPRARFSARVDAQLARGGREALESIPGVREANQRMSSLMPLEEVVLGAERAAVRGGGGIKRTMAEQIHDMLLPARLTSRAALGLDSNVGQGVLRGAPMTSDMMLRLLSLGRGGEEYR